MTKFCGDAVGVRKGRGGDSGKKRQKALEQFIETGKHPDIERAQAMARTDRVPPLPDHDPNRDFVFLDLTAGGKPLGRLVIELYCDMMPIGANHLRNRCLPGSRFGLAGSAVHKLHPNYAMWLGKCSGASEGMRIPLNNQELRHADKGAVSVSLDGDEVAISLARALNMDMTHQVVGRVHKGLEILDAISDMQVTHEDLPLNKVVVAKSGATNAKGSHEELDESKPRTAAEAAAKLAEESADARKSVMRALEEGLGSKRKAQDEGGQQGGSLQGAGQVSGGAGAGGSVSGGAGKGGAAAASASGTGTAGRNVKARVKALDAMLGDLGSGSDDESESEDGA